VGRWLTDSQILKYEDILLENSDLILNTDSSLNPAEFLIGGTCPSSLEYHCLDLTNYQTQIRPEIQETPILKGFQFFVDESSWMIHGKKLRWETISRDRIW
jgi:hypothetical protein